MSLRRDIALTSSRLLAEARIRKAGTNTIGMEIEMAWPPGEPNGDDATGATFDPPTALRDLEPDLKRFKTRTSLLPGAKFQRRFFDDVLETTEQSLEFIGKDYRYGTYVDERNERDGDSREAHEELMDALEALNKIIHAGLIHHWFPEPNGTVTLDKVDLDDLHDATDKVLDIIDENYWLIDPEPVEPEENAEETFRHAFDSIGWGTEDDGSIEPWGKEAVSPIYPIGNLSGFKQGLQAARSLIRQGWEFNESTGIHIHVGTLHPPDSFYVLSLIGQVAEHAENEIYHHFPMREGNQYAESMRQTWDNVLDDLWQRLKTSKSRSGHADELRIQQELQRLRTQGPGVGENELRKSYEERRALVLLGPDEVPQPASVELSDAQTDALLTSNLARFSRYFGVNAIPALVKHGTIEFRYFHGDPFMENPSTIDRLMKLLRQLVHNAQTASFIDAKGDGSRPRLIIERAQGGGINVHEPSAAPSAKVRQTRHPVVVGHLDKYEAKRLLSGQVHLQSEPPRTHFPGKERVLSPIAAAYAKARETASKKTQKARKQKA